MVLVSAGSALGTGWVPLLTGGGAEDHCERVRAVFERTGKWARELATTFEGLDAEGPAVTAGRLATIREGLQQEAALLGSTPLPASAAELQARGGAVLSLLVDLADPDLTLPGWGDREELASFVREQFLAARSEARAAAAALRQAESDCPNRRPAEGLMRLMRGSH